MFFKRLLEIFWKTSDQLSQQLEDLPIPYKSIAQSVAPDPMEDIVLGSQPEVVVLAEFLDLDEVEGY